jgi:hypothetical protein
MLWMLLALLMAIWVVGSIAVTSVAEAAAILLAMGIVVVAVGFWERHRHTS